MYSADLPCSEHKKVTQQVLKGLERDVEVHLRPGPVCYCVLLHFIGDSGCLTSEEEKVHKNKTVELKTGTGGETLKTGCSRD